MSNNYKPQLAMDDPQIVKLLYEMIKEIVKDEIRKAPFNRNITAKVISADNIAMTASIQLLADGVTISGVKNYSGQNLAVNNLVQVTFFNNQSSNFCITLKH